MKNFPGEKIHEANNGLPDGVADAPPNAEEMTTMRASDEINNETRPARAVGAEMGVGGPHRSARRPWWAWFTQGIETAHIKTKDKPAA